MASPTDNTEHDGNGDGGRRNRLENFFTNLDEDDFPFDKDRFNSLDKSIDECISEREVTTIILQDLLETRWSQVHAYLWRNRVRVFRRCIVLVEFGRGRPEGCHVMIYHPGI